MPYRTSRRKRSFDQRYEWNAEKEPAYLHASPAPVRTRVNESLLGGSIMLCCGEFRCVCRCPGCDKPSVTGMRCGACEVPAWLETLRTAGAL